MKNTIPIPSSAPVVSISQSCHCPARPGTNCWCISSVAAYNEVQHNDIKNMRSLFLVILLMVFDVQIPITKKMNRCAPLRNRVSNESSRVLGTLYSGGANKFSTVSTISRVSDPLSSADITAGCAENRNITIMQIMDAAAQMKSDLFLIWRIQDDSWLDRLRGVKYNVLALPDILNLF